MKRLFLCLIMTMLLLAGCGGQYRNGVRLASSGVEFECDNALVPLAAKQVEQLKGLFPYAKDKRVGVCVCPSTTPIASTTQGIFSDRIVLSVGLLKDCPREEMVRCAVAHELAHIDMKHVEEQKAIINRTGTPYSTELYGVIERQELEADRRAVEILEKSGMQDSRRWMAHMLEWLNRSPITEAEEKAFRDYLATFNDPNWNAWGERMLKAGNDVQGRIRALLGDEALEKWRSTPQMSYPRIAN